MKKLKLLTFFITTCVFANAQSFSYYDINSGTIQTIEGLTGDKVKLKKGIKQGRIEQVVVMKEVKYLDDFKYIPDVEKSFSDTSISVRNLIKNGVKDFSVFVGNYVDGLKQGEFKLLYFSSNQMYTLAKINYLNDTVSGDFNFNEKAFYYNRIGSTLLNVKISNQKILDQSIQLSNDQYIVYKNGMLDSGYIYRNEIKFYFKILSQTKLIDMMIYKSSNLFTKLNVSDANLIISRPINEDRFDKNFFMLNCNGFTVTKSRYYTYKIKNGIFIDKFNCYYKNDSLNYSVNIKDNSIELWYDNSFDTSIPTLELQKRTPHVSLNDLLAPSDYTYDHNLSIVNYDNKINFPEKGYFKISEINNLNLKQRYDGGSGIELNFFHSSPFDIDYKIDNRLIRNETWNEKGVYNFTNYDINGKVLSSSVIEKKQEDMERKENEQMMLKAFGVKDDNDVVNCEFCNKKIVKKNGITIRSAQCQSTSIGCTKANGNPCEWSFCNVNCSNEFQCSKCADYKEYRKNCH